MGIFRGSRPGSRLRERARIHRLFCKYLQQKVPTYTLSNLLETMFVCSKTHALYSYFLTILRLRITGQFWKCFVFMFQAPPLYKFQYSVEDPKTHDIKSQEEYREGDLVKGYYKLLEPTGYYRIVKYTADKKSGFVADVTRTKSSLA